MITILMRTTQADVIIHPCPGDINDDGTVNVSDLLEFFQLYGVDCPE